MRKRGSCCKKGKLETVCGRQFKLGGFPVEYLSGGVRGRSPLGGLRGRSPLGGLRGGAPFWRPNLGRRSQFSKVTLKETDTEL